ncbi:hypothetical protein NPIL_185211 [Nephila pilipes]|uniref:Uncharacterized protein n=1 Tax=Nephila pilipes TaxID=299642 RepID=A0A8X6Q5I4_NEPPI|nr:hypothetical protein NPIL_185211 [Nephila pilipes]
MEMTLATDADMDVSEESHQTYQSIDCEDDSQFDRLKHCMELANIETEIRSSIRFQRRLAESLQQLQYSDNPDSNANIHHIKSFLEDLT